MRGTALTTIPVCTFVILGGLIVPVDTAYGQRPAASTDSPNPGPTDGTVMRPKDPTVTIDIVGEGSFSGTAQMRILIKNNEPDHLLCIKEIDIVGPTKFSRSAFSLPHSPDKFLVCMDASSQYPLTAPLQREANRFDTWLTIYGYKEQVYATIRYEVWPQDWLKDKPSQTLRYGTSNASGEYIYRTPTTGLLVGALAGWSLLSLVIIIRSRSAKAPAKVPWGGLFTALIGSLILTLALKYGATISLPVTLGVNDFYGALLVGLLSHRLSSPLLAWLGLAEAKHPIETAATEKVAAENASSAFAIERAADNDRADAAKEKPRGQVQKASAAVPSRKKPRWRLW